MLVLRAPPSGVPTPSPLRRHTQGADPRALDYSVDASRAPAFEAAVRSYYPSLPPGGLSPAYAGVRPKLSAPGQPAADFCVSGPRAHGVPGYVALYGIESPGLTACLALAEHAVRELLEGAGRGGGAAAGTC